MPVTPARTREGPDQQPARPEGPWRDIAEFGAGNARARHERVRKGGQEFLLTTNNSRGVMKIPTNTFASATPITAPVESETGGVPFEKVTTMTGIQQLDKLDDNNSIVVARTAAG